MAKRDMGQQGYGRDLQNEDVQGQGDYKERDKLQADILQCCKTNFPKRRPTKNGTMQEVRR